MAKIIALSGASGLIGSKLKRALEEQSLEVWPLVRSKYPVGSGQIAYDYESGFIEDEKLGKSHAVIHLAGKNIMTGLWTTRFKQELYDSRVRSTELIARAVAKQGTKILLNASAIGIYGDRGDELIDEHSSSSTGFMADLCLAWEEATAIAKIAGTRVVNLRFGVVISPNGGMLKRLEPIFKIGLGGPMGSGQQYMSLVDIDDAIAAIIFALNDESLTGPVNVVAPEPVRNQDFAHMLGLRLKRPAVLRVPAWGLKLMGEQGSMALASTRVTPAVLLDKGFRFSSLNLIEMLNKIYGAVSSNR